MKKLDSGLRRNDGKGAFGTFYEFIKVVLRVFQTVAEKTKRGERVNMKHLNGILEFWTIFVDKSHHGEEEEFLFPALEAEGVSRERGPIGVMLSEHEQCRELSQGSKTQWPPTNPRTIQLPRTSNEYVALLTQHIGKENTILFPIADAELDSNKDVELSEAFEQLERERIGVGKHDEFHALLDQLEKRCLMSAAGDNA